MANVGKCPRCEGELNVDGDWYVCANGDYKVLGSWFDNAWRGYDELCRRAGHSVDAHPLLDELIRSNHPDYAKKEPAKNTMITRDLQVIIDHFPDGVDVQFAQDKTVYEREEGTLFDGPGGVNRLDLQEIEPETGIYAAMSPITRRVYVYVDQREVPQ